VDSKQEEKSKTDRLTDFVDRKPGSGKKGVPFLDGVCNSTRIYIRYCDVVNRRDLIMDTKLMLSMVSQWDDWLNKEYPT